MRITIKTKLIAAFALILVLVASLSFVSITRLAAANDTLAGIVERDSEAVRLAGTIQANMLGIAVALRAHIAATDDAQLRRIEAEIETLRASIEDRIGRIDDIADGSLDDEVANLRQAREVQREAVDRVLELSSALTNTRALELSMTVTRDATREARAQIAAMEQALSETARSGATALDGAGPSPDAARAARMLLVLKDLDADILEAMLGERNAIVDTRPAEIAAQADRARAALARINEGIDALDATAGAIFPAERQRLRTAISTYAASQPEILSLAIENSEAKAA